MKRASAIKVVLSCTGLAGGRKFPNFFSSEIGGPVHQLIKKRPNLIFLVDMKLHKTWKHYSGIKEIFSQLKCTHSFCHWWSSVLSGFKTRSESFYITTNMCLLQLQLSANYLRYKVNKMLLDFATIFGIDSSVDWLQFWCSRKL
jgi:hypothetical protein